MPENKIFQICPAIRYCATYRQGKLTLEERAGVQDSSSNESDRYEELLVNPTLLTLAGQRGAIDCGGTDFIIVGYGNFLQLLIALPDGHVSVAFERNENPMDYVERIRKACLGL